MKRKKGQVTGIAGVYYVAAELTIRGLVALVTIRNTRAVDIVALNTKSLKSIGVQVKTNSATSPHDFWLLSEKDKRLPNKQLSRLVYVFVNLNPKAPPSFFVVPADIVKKNCHVSRRKKSIWYSFWMTKASASSHKGYVYCHDKYKDKWEIITGKTS